VATKPGPAVNQPVTNLTFMPWWIHWDAVGKQLIQQISDQFGQTHKGLRLTPLPGPQGGGIYSNSVLTSIIAGTGPDVVADCCAAWLQYKQANAFVNLDPYLSQDNISITSWGKAQVDAMRSAEGQFGLPVYNGPVVYAYRQDILDQLGLAYPDPNWTYKEAADLWTRCAGEFQVGGKPQHRYGADFLWYTNRFYGFEYLFHGFGGAVMDSTRTQALFAEPKSLDAVNWVYPLLWNGVLGASTGAMTNGTAVFSYSGGWAIPHNAQDYANLKWAYVPAPQWPAGRATFSNNDFWGLVANGKNVDKAWEVMKWLTYEDTYQQFVMRTTLLPPSKASLWSEFKALLEAAAPGLKGKGLEYFVDAAQGGYGYPSEFFRYQNAEVATLLGATVTKIYSRELDITTGLTASAQQVDAIESGSAAAVAASSKAEQQALSVGNSSKNTQLLAPTKTGDGLAPTPAPKLIQSAKGVWTVIGAGSDVSGISDNGTLAALADTNSVATWTCRVTAFANVNEPYPESYSKIGLMARGDLSTNAPMMLIAVTAAAGIQLLYRPMRSVAVLSRLAGTKTTGGLIGQPTLTSNNKTKAANYLLKDVWLQISRQGDQWTASTSLDGKTFTAVAPAIPILMAGAWVGPFVSAANAGFPKGAGMEIQGTFDRLSFTPTEFYQLGTA